MNKRNKQTKKYKTKDKHKVNDKYKGRIITQKNKKIYGGSGVFDLVGNKISQYSGKATEYVKDKGLRMLGLQSIKQPDQINTNNGENDIVPGISNTEITDSKINEINSLASGVISGAKTIGSNIVNVVDKGSSAIINNINDVLQSPKVGETLNETAIETAAIGEKLLENFNDKISSPEIKEEASKAIENVADYAEIAINAIDKPLNKAIDELSESGTKAASGAISGAIKVGTDALAAVPGAGAVIEVGKMINDASAAAGDVVEAASQAASTVSKVVEETSKNIEEGVHELQEKKKMAQQIVNRTNKSINSFENPLPVSLPLTNNKPIGGRKTKRGLFKRKLKTKRVRFAI